MKQLILKQETISLSTSLWLGNERIPVRVENVEFDGEITRIEIATTKEHPLLVENYTEGMQ